MICALSQGNTWKKLNIDIGAYKNFVILIVATRGSNWQGDIAIDDISFSNCFADVSRNCTQNEVGSILNNNNNNNLGPPQTKEIVIDNYLYSTTKMSRQLLVLDRALPHTRGQNYR